MSGETNDKKMDELPTGGFPAALTQTQPKHGDEPNPRVKFARLFEYLPEFVLLVFAPIGLWIIQPGLDKLT
jgi:hypothetical protein